MGALFLIFLGRLLGRNWNKIKEAIGEVLQNIEKDMQD